MKHQQDLVGVGGWLTLLIAGLVVIGPFGAWSEITTTFGALESQRPSLPGDPEWARHKTIVWTFFWSQVAIGVVAGVRLATVHNRQSVHIAIAALWLIGLTNLVASAFVVSRARVDNTPASSVDVISGAAMAILLSAVWTAYLLMSRRVRYTYGTSGQPVDVDSVLRLANERGLSISEARRIIERSTGEK